MAAWCTQYVVPWITFVLILYTELLCTVASDQKLHIVYMGDTQNKGGNFYTEAVNSHHDMLESLLGSRQAAKASLKRSYWKSFSGFAALLSPLDVKQLSNTDGVVSVFESKRKELLTTRSWDYIGFPLSAQNNNLDHQEDVIIGVLDTGIWPESESFDDTGSGSIPSKWRGSCQTSFDFPTCNKKIVGAKWYSPTGGNVPAGEYFSARDASGHGTHTSSTAGGNGVRNASVYGLAHGTARGGVPGARLAMYKVCWLDYCDEADILAAFDDAIYDGVDVISVSIGSASSIDYFQDSIAIGAFHAMKMGILVSNAAGNDGPDAGLVVNASPWSLTVAATTTDRSFQAQLLLGNQESMEGVAINTFSMEKSWYPLIFGGDAANVSAGFTSDDSRLCLPNSLDATKVKGKIVLCYMGYIPDETVLLAGGVGEILIGEIHEEADEWLIPATVISVEQGNKVMSYINSTSSPVARILKTTTLRAPRPPVVASFSSRGFNQITMDVLKPDIAAPGVNILAAWPHNLPISTDPFDTRLSKFNVLSGTSMSTPHAAGAAAYVKSYHPEWSPAAIKSALMTTAYVMDPSLPGNGGVGGAEFGYGSGQINPIMAINPGLVYDADANDYINMLCSQGYNDTTLRLVTGDFIDCSSANISEFGARELNYPSITIVGESGKPVNAKIPRTVTNVGPAVCTYRAKLSSPSGVKMTVKPNTLSFTYAKEKLSYNVTVKSGAVPSKTLLSGSLTWRCGRYNVRSPVVLFSIPFENYQN